MALVKITLEDLPGGKVKVVAEPNFETLIRVDVSGNKLTAAQGYAVGMLNYVRAESKKNDPRSLIQIPRLRPGKMH